MHTLLPQTAWTKQQFARASTAIARQIGRNQMGINGDISKLKSGDAAIIKTCAITAAVVEGLHELKKNEHTSKPQSPQGNADQTTVDQKTGSEPSGCSKSVAKSSVTCEWLQSQLEKLKNMWTKVSPNLKQAANAAMCAGSAAAIATVLICISEGKDAKETISLVFRNFGISGISAGIISLITDFAVSHWEVIKNLAMGIGAELTEQTTKQFCTVVVGAVLCSVIEMVLWTANALSEDDSWGEFAKKFFTHLCDSIALNLGSAGVGAFIACACPAWATMIIMIMVGCVIGRIKQQAHDNKESVIASAFHGLTVMPLAVYNYVMQTKHDDVPIELCCVVHSTLLEDPVWVQNQWMDRKVAFKLAVKGSRGPAGYIVRSEEIVESLEMKSLVQKYKWRFGKEE